MNDRQLATNNGLHFDARLAYLAGLGPDNYFELSGDSCDNAGLEARNIMRGQVIELSMTQDLYTVNDGNRPDACRELMKVIAPHIGTPYYGAAGEMPTFLDWLRILYRWERYLSTQPTLGMIPRRMSRPLPDCVPIEWGKLPPIMSEEVQAVVDATVQGAAKNVAQAMVNGFNKASTASTAHDVAVGILDGDYDVPVAAAAVPKYKASDEVPLHERSSKLFKELTGTDDRQSHFIVDGVTYRLSARQIWVAGITQRLADESVQEASYRFWVIHHMIMYHLHHGNMVIFDERYSYRQPHSTPCSREILQMDAQYHIDKVRAEGYRPDTVHDGDWCFECDHACDHCMCDMDADGGYAENDNEDAAQSVLCGSSLKNLAPVLGESDYNKEIEMNKHELLVGSTVLVRNVFPRSKVRIILGLTDDGRYAKVGGWLCGTRWVSTEYLTLVNEQQTHNGPNIRRPISAFKMLKWGVILWAAWKLNVAAHMAVMLKGLGLQRISDLLNSLQ